MKTEQTYVNWSFVILPTRVRECAWDAQAAIRNNGDAQSSEWTERPKLGLHATDWAANATEQQTSPRVWTRSKPLTGSDTPLTNARSFYCATKAHTPTVGQAVKRLRTWHCLLL